MLSQLVCPICKSKLSSNRNKLHCRSCHTDYSINNKIPNFLSKELKKEVVQENQYWNDTINIGKGHLYENLDDKEFYKLLGLFNIHPNTIGLELGCGDGPFSRRLPEKIFKIYGVDISHNLLRYSKNLFPVQANALQLPFKSNFFDWTIYAFSLHHMVDIEKAVREAVRVSKQYGKIYIVEPNYYHPIRFMTRKPNTFIRRHFFKYLTPSEQWISSNKLNKILKSENVSVKKIIYLTPRFKHSSLCGKIQFSLSQLFNYKLINQFIHSYYIIEGIKQ